MFERYTERARRVLFFARYEASNYGSLSIETEHLLLGLIRENRGITSRLFASAQVSTEDLRRDVDGQAPVFRERVSTSMEIPFTADAKRALEGAAEEADGLGHSYIGTEHLLLALLRDPHTVAGSILTKAGLDHDRVRADVIELLKQRVEQPQESPRRVISVSPLNLLPQIEKIKTLVDLLAQMQPATPEMGLLVEAIKRELDKLTPPPGTWMGFTQEDQ